MNKAQKGSGNRKEKTVPEGLQIMLTEERAFRDTLKECTILKADTPVEVFKQSFKFEKIQTSFKSQAEANNIHILILNEIFKLLETEGDIEPYVMNILRIFNKEDLKTYTQIVSAKAKELKKAADQYSFVQPKEELILQKLGRILKKVVLRQLFLTSEAFGQVTKKDAKLMIKPNMFRDQEAEIQNKRVAIEAMKFGKDSKGRKAFAWPDKKELADISIRVTFLDLKQRQRAIYCSSDLMAYMLKDNAIVRRILDKNANIKARITQFKNIWKTRCAELFYKNHLQKFFDGYRINERILLFNETLKGRLKAYLKKRIPNLYESNYIPVDVYNFEDNKHMAFQHKSNQHEEDIEIIKRQLATIINPELFIRPDENKLLEQKRKILQRSPFEELVKAHVFDEGIFHNMLDSFGPSVKKASADKEENIRFLEFMAVNSKMLLKLDKIILANVFNQKEFPFDENEVEDLFFDIQLFVEQGNQSGSGCSFLREVDPGYIAFDANASIKVDLNSLKHLHIKLTDKVTGKEYVDEVINIRDALDSVFLESYLVKEFEFKYKGVSGLGALVFNIAFVPRNLEAAHIVLNSDLISNNFDKFDAAIKTSEDFTQYRKNFFPKAKPHLQYGNNLNFQFYYNSQICRTYLPLFKQEHMFLNNIREYRYSQLVSFLQNVATREVHPIDIFLNTSSMLKTNGKLHINPYYDLIVYAVNILPAPGRLLVNKIVFEYSHKEYVNFRPDIGKVGFDKGMAGLLNEGLKEYFERNPHIRSDHIALIKKISFELYLLFDNNIFNGKLYKIEFSPKYIPIIGSLVQVNASQFNDETLVFLCTETILSNNLMKKHSAAAHLMYLDSLCLFFKMTFKNMYSDSYALLQHYAIDFDDIIYSGLINSFADYFTPVNYTAYLDVKATLHSVFIIHSKAMRLLSLLEQMEIEFGSLIDVLFLLSVLASHASHIKVGSSPATFRSELQDAIRREALNIKQVTIKLIELLDFVYDREFFRKEFIAFKEISTQKNQSTIASFRNLSLNLKSLNIDIKTIKKVIEIEIGGNQALQSRALSLYSRPPIEEKSLAKRKHSEDDEDEGRDSEAPSEMVEADVYFDILEGHEIEAMTNQPDTDKKLPKATGLLIHLNNLDYNLIDSLAHNQKLVLDFNNILEYTIEDLNKFFTKYFNSSDPVKLELYTDLTNIVKSKKIPFLKMLVIFTAAFSESKSELLLGLEILAREISRIFFPAEPSFIFNEALKYVISEVQGLVPITFFTTSLNNAVDTHSTDLYCNVKSAKISFGHDVIDVTEITIRHFASNTFINKRSSILFGVLFCNDLCSVFQDLANNSHIDTSIDKFELTIEYYNKGMIERFNIPFRINFEEYVKIICKHQNTFFFDNFITENNLCPPKTLAEILLRSPFFYFSDFISVKIDSEFVDIPFTFKFKHKEVFLTVDVIFTLEDHHRPCSTLTAWRYPTDNIQKLTKFDNPGFTIYMNYALFLLPVKQLHEILCLRIIESLDAKDIFKFVKLNSPKFEILTEKKKTVDEGAYLFELGDYAQAVRQQKPMTVYVNYHS